jgi:uncharacterized membrane protein
MLAAMQVGLSVDRLAASEVFQWASYALTLFSLVAPIFGAMVIFVVLLAMYLHHWQATKGYERKRFNHMGVEPTNYLQVRQDG